MFIRINKFHLVKDDLTSLGLFLMYIFLYLAFGIFRFHSLKGKNKDMHHIIYIYKLRLIIK